MSKAFVIKNKEGKYLYEYGYNKFGDNICCAYIKEDRDVLEKLLKDWEIIFGKGEVVPITIVEGDLEQENKQLEEQHDLLINEFQKQREDLCKQIKQESDARKNFVEKVKQLKEELAKKDKEIAFLTECNKSLSNKFDKESDMQNKIDILKYNIEGLEEQNNMLIKERDELAFEKRNIFGLIEKVSDKGQLEIRRQICAKIKEKAKWSCPNDLKWTISAKDLEQIEKGETK